MAKMKQLDEIREKIEDIIKENLPFYTSYKILRNEYYWKISVTCYYMGKKQI